MTRRQEPSALKRSAGQRPFREGADPEIITRFNQECRSAGKFIAIRQVQDEVRKTTCKSGAVKGNEAEIPSRDHRAGSEGQDGSSQEVNPWDRAKINRVYG